MKSSNYLVVVFIFSLFWSYSIASQNKEEIDENILRETQVMTYKGFEISDGIINAHINFNDNWKFKLGTQEGFEKSNFNDTNWRLLTLPHDWSVEGVPEKTNPSGIRGGFYPMGIGCYRKSFVLGEEAVGKRVKIRFDGVYMNSKVYINGVFLGLRPYGFSTFEYDISPYLKFDEKENIIAVEVDNSLQQNCRWYTGSGINRNVHLFITEQQHFQSYDTFFRTVALEDNNAIVKVDCKVKSNNYPKSERVKFQLLPQDITYIEKKAKVVVSIKDASGLSVSELSQTLTLRDYQEKELSFDLLVKDPKLWSDTSPILYQLEVKLLVEEELVHTEVHTVGIRMIKFSSSQGMLVNGKKVIVKGVCLHKDAASFGTAVPKDVWRFRLEKLKRMGCNALRTHGPSDPIFIEVCDELGFYLMSEAFDEWEKNWEFGLSETPSGKLPYTYHQYFKQWAETDLKEMIRRDRNHPSVFIYSIGNEVPEQRFDHGAKVLTKLQDWAHEIDNTRPVTVGCDWSQWGNKNGFMDAMDIAGYNYPDRYYPELYKEEHAKYPDRILLGTENYINQKNWLSVRDNPFVVGMFLWVGIDYLGESHRWPRRSWEWGIIDLASFEKSMYYNWKANWTDKPMVHTAVLLKNAKPFKWRPIDMRSHWNFENKAVDTVFVFSNTKEVELFQNGKTLERKPVDPDNYKAIYIVDYQKGELESKAYTNGKVVATHTIKTAGKPYKLGISNQRPYAHLNKEELIFLAIEVQDKNGECYPYADNEIIVNVEGAGKLVGLDSADPFSHEVFKINKRKAYEGKLLLTIKPTNSGELIVKCTSEDIKQIVYKIMIP